MIQWIDVGEKDVFARLLTETEVNPVKTLSLRIYCRHNHDLAFDRALNQEGRLEPES